MTDRCPNCGYCPHCGRHDAGPRHVYPPTVPYFGDPVTLTPYPWHGIVPPTPTGPAAINVLLTPIHNSTSTVTT